MRTYLIVAEESGEQKENFYQLFSNKIGRRNDCLVSWNKNTDATLFLCLLVNYLYILKDKQVKWVNPQSFTDIHDFIKGIDRYSLSVHQEYL